MLSYGTLSIGLCTYINLYIFFIKALFNSSSLFLITKGTKANQKGPYPISAVESDITYI